MNRAAFALAALMCVPVHAADLAGHVVAFPDGDTVTVRTSDGRRHRVRLDGIDAPERTQPYSQISRRNLVALIGDGPVTVESNKVDRHGRAIGVVRNVAGQDVGLEQVKAGLAWHFARYELEQTPDDRAAYAAAEVIARAARIGLWRQDSPLPPWEFRRLAREGVAPTTP